MLLIQRGAEGNFTMNLSENVAYLFHGIPQGITVLEAETYLYRALNTRGIRPRYTQATGEVDDDAYVSRWPEHKFPLKIYAGADYGFLFTPVELKQLGQLLQSALNRISDIDPETFRFTMVPDRQQADIVIKFRRFESAMASHCTPEIGAEKQIKWAEIVLNISRNHMSQSQIFLDMIHNLLHAMGIFGHSDNPMDTGAKDWTPQQQILTHRDMKTLQLLYRCPIALTRRDISLLWQQYQQHYLSLPSNSSLEMLISDVRDQEAQSLAQVAESKSSDLSLRELALQLSFLKCLSQLKTA